ncbi:MAG: TatD family deoxyribonuclease [Betaproteobacteria bacterium]|nr:TatD family deoxyribonuclease [Betaproteobacteria bacterium]
MVIDSHCHLDFEDFNSDREAVLERMAQAGVQQAVCISVKLDDLPTVLALAQAKPQEGASECAGVMHCFTEDWETARASLDLGFYISFSGIVTFKSAAALREVAKKIPLDRILVETDAPYLAPVPHRGKRNEPAMVVATARFLADWLQLDFDEFSALTDSNCYRLFKRLQPIHIT